MACEDINRIKRAGQVNENVRNGRDYKQNPVEYVVLNVPWIPEKVDRKSKCYHQRGEEKWPDHNEDDEEKDRSGETVVEDVLQANPRRCRRLSAVERFPYDRSAISMSNQRQVSEHTERGNCSGVNQMHDHVEFVKIRPSVQHGN